MQKLSSPVKLIGESFRIFFAKENVLYFVSIYLILVPFQVFSYFQESVIGSESLNNIWLGYAVIAINVLNFILYLLTSAAGIIAVKNVVDNRQLSFKNTAIFAWNKLWEFFLLSTLLFLIIIGGFILLIIPGILFSIWFTFARYIFIDQGLGIKASLVKSRELIKGRFWPIFWRLLVIGLFFGIFAGISTYLLTLIPFGMGSAISPLAGALFVLPYYLLYKELVA